ncbi:MAG: hypothetical protein M3Z32_00625 [Acidobacteriota bacterium]|nr:hypothetical protein [Acidobacteriota bacterium]
MRRSQATSAVVVLCALAVIAYWPAQKLPFIADDYVQIQLGRDYGAVHSWIALMRDPLYRCRATSVVLTHWTEQVAGLNPLFFNLSSLFLHISNTLLVFALGSWAVIGWKRSFAAAVFFAVAEGHQEAVIWYAAVPELLVFLFSATTFLAFVWSITHERWRSICYVTALASFVLALASKESAVVTVGALALACIIQRLPLRQLFRLLIPFGLLATGYVYAIFASSGTILHFHDGAFSLSGPFIATSINSAAHIMWFWGIPAIIALFVWDREAIRTVLPVSLSWMFIALFPYSFLTYMNRVPSRHTYFASVGLSLIVATAFLAVTSSRRKTWTLALATIVLVYNCAYLWTKKQAQYERRAESTEQLLRVYSRNPSSVRIECFPYSRWIAQYAVEIGTGRNWNERTWQPRLRCDPDQTVITAEY